MAHRDIKPENLLFENEEPYSKLKLIDFGIAERLYRKVNTANLIGSAFYIAPEVIAGDYDAKCDIWSCGTILYLLLCMVYVGGFPPFNGETDFEILSEIKYKEV